MSLPHEAEVIAAIATQYRTRTGRHGWIARCGRRHNDGGLMDDRQSGLDGFVGEIMMGLLTKACKTFRSIQILCERGLIEDANALVRVLMENTVAIAFILQKKPRERARIYYAHTIAQSIKMLNDWKTTPGLERKVTKKVIKEANDALAAGASW